MKKARESLNQFRGFLSDVGAEMRKCTWPERQELLESTVVVIVSVIMLSLFVGLCDKVMVFLLKLLIRSG